MKLFWTKGINPRHGVLLLTAAVGIALIALLAYDLRREYVAGIEAANSKTQNLTRMLEEHARQSLRRVELIVEQAAEEFKGGANRLRADPAALRERLRVHIPADDLITLFLVLDRNGAVVLSTLTENLGNQPEVADRDYFAAHRERAGLGTVIGAPVKGRVTGRWTLPVSIRLDAPGGGFSGVLVAFAAPDHFQSFYDSIDTGANGFVTLLQRQGWIVARSPFDERVMSRSWIDSPMFREHLASSQVGTVRQVVAADGVERIYSYRSLDDYPVIVSTGVSLTDALAGWRARLWRDGLMLFVALGLLCTGAFALSRQLRKREAADAALRESGARLKLAIGAAKASLWERDLRNKKIYLSPEYQRQIGLGPTDFHGEYEYWENRLHPEDRSRALTLVTDCSEGRTVGYDSEYRLRHTDGGYRWFLSRGALVRDEAGKPKRLIGVLIDITERKRAEEAMRESEERFRSLTNLSSDLYWEQDDQFRFTSISGTGSQRVNLTTLSLIGRKRWEQNYLNMTEDKWAEHIALLEAHKPFRDMELCRLDESGGKVWISVSGEPVFHPSGALKGYRGVGKDITERKQNEEARQKLEDRLRQAQKMEAIGTLAGGIAHDFNNIVATILGNAELASRDASPNHPVQESISEIRKAGLRAKGVVQQILAFAREAKPESRLIRLPEVLAEDEKLLRAAIPTGVELHFSVAPGIPEVLADPTQVHQILLNLCTNSWQAMRGGVGRIEIALDGVTVDDKAARSNHELSPGRYARLSVTDTGAGMDEPTLKRIFDPFFTTKEVGQGTGLGLAVVHGIMRVLGGAIEVASQLGRGTTFRLYFRAAMAVPDVPSAAPGEARRGNGEHILFLDDEEALAFLTRRALERDGYRVSAFTKTEEALEELRARPDAFDLVVTDLNMPGRSGLEVAKEIRALRPDLPVVLASGYVTREVHAQARAAGVCDVIYKPTAVDELARTVGRVLAEVAAR